MSKMHGKAQVALFGDGSWELITTEWTPDHENFGASYMTDEQMDYIESLHPSRDYIVQWKEI